MKILLLLILLIPVQSYADCQSWARRFGNGEGPDVFPKECFAAADRLAAKEARKLFRNGKLKVIGLKNVVLVNELVIAGSSTMLEDVIAVDFDEVNQEVAALERNGDVLIFSARITGNVAPLRVIRSPELHGARDVQFLPKSGEISVDVATPDGDEVLRFHRLANFFGREETKRLTPKRRSPRQTASVN